MSDLIGTYWMKESHLGFIRVIRVDGPSGYGDFKTTAVQQFKSGRIITENDYTVTGNQLDSPRWVKIPEREFRKFAVLAELRK